MTSAFSWQNSFCLCPASFCTLRPNLPVMYYYVFPHNTFLIKSVLYIIGDWNTKVGSQEIPGVTGKFGLGVQNEAGQKLIKFCQENALVLAKRTLLQQHKRQLYTWTSPEGQY